jgi:hypothetical protein
MTATLDDVTKKKAKAEPSAQEQVAEELVARAREQGLSLTGPDGLLKQLTKTVLETALNQEMTEHLGHDKHAPPGNETGNVRSGTRPKTVLTEATGQAGIEVPRDRDGSFEPQIVRKRQRRLSGVDEMVLSLYAKGLTTGEISAHHRRRRSCTPTRRYVRRDVLRFANLFTLSERISPPAPLGSCGSSSRRSTGCVKLQGSEQRPVSMYPAARSIYCPRQDSNLRSRLRRGLLCVTLTSGNEFPYTMIGGVSGGAHRTWAAGHAECG